MRLSKALKEFNVTLQRAVAALKEQGHEIEENLNTKISDEQYAILQSQFSQDKKQREEAAALFGGRHDHEEKETTSAPKQKKAEAVVPEPAAPAVEETPEPKAEEPAPVATPAPEPQPEVAEAPTVAPEPAPIVETADPQPAETAMPEAEDTSAPAKPTVEQRAAAMGTENKEGVYRLNSSPQLEGPKVLGTIDLSSINSSTRPPKKSREELRQERNGKRHQGDDKKKRTRIGGTERVDVNAEAKKGNASKGAQGGRNNAQNAQKQGQKTKGKKGKTPAVVTPPSDEDVAKQVKETLARLQAKGASKGKGAKYRKEKRDAARERQEEELMKRDAESSVLKLTEFVTANELATMMDVPVTKVIGTCMSIGIMVSINQRLDQETIEMVAEEFGFTTEFVSAEVQEAIVEEEDNPEDLVERAPIVTVMGHVDHGKTSLLDHIRNANVIAGEAGGITQHIGAYNVKLKNGREITFLDTPGHEAFTAMRARGAQVTDIAIIIIAADDNVMPQTKEAINHATAAGVPIIFAINKIDKDGANPDAIKTTLASMNYLVEEWGGKYQSQDIAAKKGIGVYELLEKVLLEADMLELKANPNRRAVGTVIESSLDKGRGYVSTVLVSNGTLRQGDIIVAGTNHGRVKALFNERGQRVEEVRPAHAATVLGFNGAPQAGDQFNVMESEQEARDVANKRLQLQREQNLRTSKMLTLDEIGRRLKLGDYQEINLVIKGDVDGSVQALSDSFIKLSTENIAINVIHKGVGQISENDVTLAAASKAVIIGFQVRPSAGARKLAERDGVDIRQYSIIYDAIEEVKEAMEGMLKPIVKEEVTAMVEVRQVFHISKVGYIAGAYVVDGKVSRQNKARLIRDGVVVFTGEIAALKRFKDDVKEVTTNFECGISLQGCNDIKEGDVIETFQEVEVKQKLNA
ncbi:translation initiation factor IF-2 [Alloprevotella sp. Lung230]|uniref:translation initiation factor IF-2 n=1 Tax=Alloprevotella sp. Lung230 TaxID=2766595 RepID=UPI001656405D|nr:translation initiation factor IF-2 [Alloprevotella sp. Lung230]MBC8626498.1 translation initiation factor IF-2 [Alloprevotella sp. Lung230]